jgi:FAS-associated factor 2
VTPFLERVKLSQKEREQERILREEQDKAFRRSAQRDREKIAVKMAAEKLELEERQRKLDEARAEELRKQKEEEKRLRLRELRMDWRRWTRHAMPFPDLRHSQEVLRIAVRFPEGRRIIHHFPPTATLTTLYAFVDVQLLPPDLLPEKDPSSPPDGTLSGESALEHQILTSDDEEEWWRFKLVQPYPRQEIRWEVGRQLSEVEGLAGRGQVVVEMIERIIPADEDEASDG